MNENFGVTKADIARAAAIVDAYEANTGSSSFTAPSGIFVDEAIYNRAFKILTEAGARAARQAS